MNHAASKELSISALTCHKCGAPMYPDMKKGGFSCLYCDTFRPFAVTDEDFAPAVKFRHQPVILASNEIYQYIMRRPANCLSNFLARRTYLSTTTECL